MDIAKSILGVHAPEGYSSRRIQGKLIYGDDHGLSSVYTSS